MILGFPIQLLTKLCCTSDGAALELDQNCQLSEDGGFVRNGTLHCSRCNKSFAINDGILNMMNDVVFHEESKHAQGLFNETANRIENCYRISLVRKRR